MSFLENITSPLQLKELSYSQLQELCAEIRKTIIDVTSQNGGHPASNLGCVELTVALHRIFDLSKTPLIFDVGHQCYTHKLLTGRYRNFNTLRQTNGLSGFSSPEESPYDHGMSGHSGSAISLAEGMACARYRQGIPGKVLALVGDASLGNGVSLEGLNADCPGRNNLIVILNDNKMSISPNVGNLSRFLNGVSTGKLYNRLKNSLRTLLSNGKIGRNLRNLLSTIEDAIKGTIMPRSSVFQGLGFRYIGPVDGHNLPLLEKILRSIRDFNEPILLHVCTEKGHGCDYMTQSPTLFHGVSGYDAATGEFKPSKPGFTTAFGHRLMKMAQEHPDLAVITPAMCQGSGLKEFASTYPGQFYDAGIAEEHAVTFSAGLATAGLRPICTIYTTFAQRALDCIYSDIVLPQVPVILALDRAGFVNDGPTHHGIYDLGFLRAMPNLEILCPRDEIHLEAMLEYAYSAKRPIVIRYPRGGTGTYNPHAPLPPLQPGKAQTIHTSDSPQVVIWALGTECTRALKVAQLLETQGFHSIVIDTQWLAPFDIETAQAYSHLLQVTLENHCIIGGLADTLQAVLPHANLLRLGWPQKIIPHGTEEEIRQQLHLTAEDITQQITHALQS